MRLRRALAAAWRAFRAELPEALPVVPEPGTPPAESASAALLSLVPPPTYAEIKAMISRFVDERMPLFPDESFRFAVYVADFASACAPALEQVRAARAALASLLPLEPPFGVN